MATLTEILIAVREISFDRFPIPSFVLKTIPNAAVTNDNSNFKILPVPTATALFNYPYTPDIANDTLENLTNALITDNRVIAYTGYYSAFDKPDQLLKYTAKPFGTTPITVFRRFFLSDLKLIDLIIEYYHNVLKITETDTVSLPTDVTELNSETIQHLTLWVALNLVDQRRIAEQAAMIYQMNWSDGSGAVAGANLNTPGQNVTVQIGNVFTLSDSNAVTNNYFSEDFNRVGSDNVLGDKESWWFKLWLYLRDKLERTFGDYSFRGDNVIVGKIILQKDLNYFAYYDSYPFTLSSLTRNIIS